MYKTWYPLGRKTLATGGSNVYAQPKHCYNSPCTHHRTLPACTGVWCCLPSSFWPIRGCCTHATDRLLSFVGFIICSKNTTHIKNKIWLRQIISPCSCAWFLSCTLPMRRSCTRSSRPTLLHSTTSSLGATYHAADFLCATPRTVQMVLCAVSMEMGAYAKTACIVFCSYIL